MVFQQLKIPKLDVDRFTKFLTSNEMIAVASAIIVTPLLLKSIESVISRFPVLRNNFTIGLLVAAFFLFVLAGLVPSGMLRSVVLGVSAGVVITAVAPFFQDAFSKLRIGG